MTEKEREQVALFRYGLIAPLLNGQVDQKEYLMEQAGKNELKVTDTQTFMFIAINVFVSVTVTRHLLVTQGSKAAVAYLKKATKNLTKTYKITFPNSKSQLILIQDKKSKARVFSIDKHNVKMVQKKNPKKGYPGSVSPWHFHVGKNSGHLMLCSSVPKNYKVENGKCYF